MRGAQYILISLAIVAALIFAARSKDDPPAAAQARSGTATAEVDGARIRAADAEPHNWMSHVELATGRPVL